MFSSKWREFSASCQLLPSLEKVIFYLFLLLKLSNIISSEVEISMARTSHFQGILHSVVWAFSLMLITSVGAYSGSCKDGIRPFTCPSLLVREFEPVSLSDASTLNPIKVF